jgi:putative heme degradation protein
LPHSHHWYFDELAKRWADSNQDPGISVQEKIEDDQTLDKSTLTTIVEERAANQKELIDLDQMQFFLNSATNGKLPLTITVQNHGVTQSHDGVIHEIQERKDWLHLSNQQFNCHLQLTQMLKIFINHQVSPYSMEIFDEKGLLLVLVTLSSKATSADKEIWEELPDKVKAMEMSLLE